MSDEPGRPRQAPRWGEYADPEEIAELRGSPPPPDAATRLPDPPPHPISAAAPGAGRWDRPVTIALLAFGLWNVLSAFPAFVALDVAMQQSFAMSAYADVEVRFGEPTRVAGIVLLAVWVALFLGAVGLSVARMRSGRRAFWIPLVAGGLAVLAMFVTIAVLVGVDPGLAPLLARPAGVSG